MLCSPALSFGCSNKFREVITVGLLALQEMRGKKKQLSRGDEQEREGTIWGKNKRQLVSSQTSFDLSFQQSRRTSRYDALEDRHASRYFVSLSVRKHLQAMVKVRFSQNSLQAFSTLPKNSENKKIAKSMARLAGLQQPCISPQSGPTSFQQQRIKRAYTSKQETNCLKDTKPLKIRKSPYYCSLRPMNDAKLDKSCSLKAKNKRMSRFSLPPLENIEPANLSSYAIRHVPVKLKLSLAVDSKAVEKLNRLKHNHLQSFLAKKREQVLQKNERLKLESLLLQYSKGD